MVRHFASLALLLVLVVSAFATTSRTDAKITSLPGLASLPTNFDQYSGYITLEGTTKNIFYWFVTAQSNAASAPVILWLQGGPGCSGLGDGFFLEHGPFSPVGSVGPKTVNLAQRFYSWNNEANIIYIESPCGVGFSYSDNLSDYTSNDNTTAYDNYLFLDGFFDIYNEFADNEFWITGESYGGIYITTLAYQVLFNSSNTQLTSNLQKGGLMLGNPVTNCDTPAYTGNQNILSLDTQVNNYYWHGMVSRRNYDQWNSKGCNTAAPSSIQACYSLYSTIFNGIGKLDQPLQQMNERSQQTSRLEPDAAINPDMLYYSYCTGNGTLNFNVDTVPECFGLTQQVSFYLNDPKVQQAIHANSLRTQWQECGGVIYKKTVGSVIPYLESFFSDAPSMRVLYYAGDLDIATVPFPQTQRCLETMQRPIVEKWRPFVVNKEVAGYVEVYDSYTFATVKGGGHEAPQFQPASNYLLFSSFLHNVSLPQ